MIEKNEIANTNRKREQKYLWMCLCGNDDDNDNDVDDENGYVNGNESNSIKWNEFKIENETVRWQKRNIKTQMYMNSQFYIDKNSTFGVRCNVLDLIRNLSHCFQNWKHSYDSS